MIETAFDTITQAAPHPRGGESRVYPLPKALSEPFGEPCVIKIYTAIAVQGTTEEFVRLEDLAKHEFDIGNGLRTEGLGAPSMYETVLFDSPPEGHVHYVQGRKIPGLVMGTFKETREFEELGKGEHLKALKSFVEGTVTAMRAGYHPFNDTCHNRNVMYDPKGNVIFYDFSQWEQVGPLDEEEIIRFFRGDGVLPSWIFESEKDLEAII